MGKIQDSSLIMKDNPASKEVVERSLAQIREILGIKEGKSLMERNPYYSIEARRSDYWRLVFRRGID